MELLERITLSPQVMKGKPARRRGHPGRYDSEHALFGNTDAWVVGKWHVFSGNFRGLSFHWAGRYSSWFGVCCHDCQCQNNHKAWCVNFIVDMQLPPQLAVYLSSKGYESIHTTDFKEGHLLNVSEIIRILTDQNRIVVSKDADFSEYCFLKGAAGYVRHLEYYRLNSVTFEMSSC